MQNPLSPTKHKYSYKTTPWLATHTSYKNIEHKMLKKKQTKKQEVIDPLSIKPIIKPAGNQCNSF